MLCNLFVANSNTSITTSHKSRAGIPSIREPPSSDIITGSASCTSNLWEQMFDFRKYIRFSMRLILKLPSLQQNRRLETVPTCIVEMYYPHDNIVDSHVCDKCRKSNELSGSCPLSDWSSKFVYGPKNVKSPNSCQIQAFQDHLRTYIVFIQA